MKNYLERYQAGDEDTVWSELVALGERVRDDDVANDAYSVACEAMRRTLKNVTTLIERLRELDFEFQSPTPRSEPAADVLAQIDELQTLAGPIPMTIRAFGEVVGSVDLRGHISSPQKPSLLTGILSRLAGQAKQAEVATVEWPSVYADAMFV